MARLVRVGPRQPHAAAYERGEEIGKGEPHGFGEGEICVEITFEMIVEDAADAAMHLAVGDVEILVRPLPEAWIMIGIVRVARGLHRGVEIGGILRRSEEHTSELQSLMRISYAVFCLKKKTN